MKWIFLRPILRDEDFQDPPSRKRFFPAYLVASEDSLPSLDANWAKVASEKGLEFSGYMTNPIVEFGLDLGGMIGQKAKTFSTTLDGLSVSVYASHVEDLIGTVRASCQEDPEVDLYNVSSWRTILVVTALQKEALLTWLLSIEGEAASYRDLENRDFNEKFANSNHVFVKPRKARKIAQA